MLIDGIFSLILIRNRLKVGTWSLGFVLSSWVLGCHLSLEKWAEWGGRFYSESRFCLKSRFSCEKLEAMRESLLTNKNNPCIDPKWWKGRLVLTKLLKLHPRFSIFGHLLNTICFGMLYTCLEGMHSRIRRCFLAWSGACKWYLTPFHPSCRVKRTGHDNQFIWWVFMWEQEKMNSRHSFHSSTQTLDDEVFCMIDAVSFYHWKSKSIILWWSCPYIIR